MMSTEWWEEGRVVIRASFLGHLCGRPGRTSSGSPFQKFHSICQLTLESESWVVIGWAIRATAVKLPAQRRGDRLLSPQLRAVGG
jgi:hypothetical protein